MIKYFLCKCLGAGSEGAHRAPRSINLLMNLSGDPWVSSAPADRDVSKPHEPEAVADRESPRGHEADSPPTASPPAWERAECCGSGRT